ncbi:hypothetical protein JTE90_023443 [Oedothorax gibbosus]|uniref:DDE Tnp4 domain-containing protein n=1 Tax=Oedothorax gibbosus TaxID=931172 RepID=A0AAV6U0V1_9ARAC|nr:hypothetical protein JTE90_023443 [Oedothorax gibbosus]
MVMTCAVLHNVCVEFKVPLPDDSDDDSDSDPEVDDLLLQVVEAVISPSGFNEFAKTQLLPDICQKAEKATCLQADTPLWHELRYGRITASKLHAAAHCHTLDSSLVEQILGTRVKETEAMKRGTHLDVPVHLHIPPVPMSLNKITQVNPRRKSFKSRGTNPIKTPKLADKACSTSEFDSDPVKKNAQSQEESEDSDEASSPAETSDEEYVLPKDSENDLELDEESQRDWLKATNEKVLFAFD